MIERDEFPSQTALSQADRKIVVLLIDDQAMIAEAVRRMLASEKDIIFHSTTDPTKAIQLARELSPTVILQDLVMPDVDGLMLVRFLRAKDAPTRDIPLIVLSSKEEPLIKAEAFRLGANDYLVKLPDKVELIARVRYHSKGYINLLQRNEAYKAVQEYSQKLENKNQLIRQVFGRYMSDEVVANLLETPKGLQLGGERREITILTSDLRGFTASSERLPPEEVIKIINLYLGYMADVITSYQGTIDEFMGDGILVLFGAPTARDDDAKRAVACAVAMQLTMKTVNDLLQAWDVQPLEMGIGINTGEVVVGNIGSEKRAKYGVVGNQVNLTYRIESYSIGGQILISESTFKQVESLVRVDGQKQVLPKGVKQLINIYEIGGIGGEYNLFLPIEEEIFYPLAEKIPFKYAILDGKHIADITFAGNIVKLSAKGAEITYENEEGAVPIALNNLKLNLFLEPGGNASEDVYGKVLDKVAGDNSVYIRFTAKPPAVDAQLGALYKSVKR